MGHLTSEKNILQAQYELHNPRQQISKTYVSYWVDKAMRKQALLQVGRWIRILYGSKLARSIKIKSTQFSDPEILTLGLYSTDTDTYICKKWQKFKIIQYSIDCIVATDWGHNCGNI